MGKRQDIPVEQRACEALAALHADADTPIVLMVSGGSDSTALAYLVSDAIGAQPSRRLAIMHFNHKLRGEDSDRDAEFVKALAKLLDIPFYVYEKDIEAMARESGENLEALARRERYRAANEVLAQMASSDADGAPQGLIFTAHTADDRIENFYMRSIVGTGPGGLRAMSRQTGNVAHPLLDCTRDELRHYLRSRAESGNLIPVDNVLACDNVGLPNTATARITLADDDRLWREDATNAEPDRFRTYVRHKIVPLAKERNPRLAQTLGRTMDLVADEDDYMAELAQQAIAEHVQWLDGGACVLAPQFGKEPLVIQRRSVFCVLQALLDPDERVLFDSVQAVLAAWSPEETPRGGYVANIQGDLAVSANKRGVRIEPMATFRARRKRS